MTNISGTLLLTDDDRIILHRRDSSAPTSPDRLGLFGGHANTDETPLEAAIRELQEETSLDISQLVLEPICDFEITDSASRKSYHFHTYKTIVPSTDFQVFEGRGLEVYTVDEALRRDDLTRSTRITIEKYRES